MLSLLTPGEAPPLSPKLGWVSHLASASTEAPPSAPGLPTSRGSSIQYSPACRNSNSCLLQKTEQVQRCKNTVRDHPLHPPQVAAVNHMSPGTWQPTGPWRLHPLTDGLHATAAVHVHPATRATSGGQATTRHPHSRDVPAPSPAFQHAESHGNLDVSANGS